jgi:beta-lactamase class D
MQMKRARRIAASLPVALCLLAAPACPQPAQPATDIAPDRFAAIIASRQVTFLARDLPSGKIFALHPERLDRRHAPWSTFKIPNLIIALETGAATGLGHVRKWNPALRPASSYWPENWRSDQTLKFAFQHSAVWYFRDIALEVGSARYRTFLRKWNYGNAEVPDGSDSFWLRQPLRISVREQVHFLEKALSGRLGISADTLSALREASLLRKEGGIALHGKTGAGPVEAGNFSGIFEGWLTGFVQRNGRTQTVFALYVRGPGFSSIRSFRRDFSETLLKEIGALPAHW